MLSRIFQEAISKMLRNFVDLADVHAKKTLIRVTVKLYRLSDLFYSLSYRKIVEMASSILLEKIIFQVSLIIFFL